MRLGCRQFIVFAGGNVLTVIKSSSTQRSGESRNCSTHRHTDKHRQRQDVFTQVSVCDNGELEESRAR